MDCLWNTVDHCRIDLYILELHGVYTYCFACSISVWTCVSIRFQTIFRQLYSH